MFTSPGAVESEFIDAYRRSILAHNDYAANQSSPVKATTVAAFTEGWDMVASIGDTVYRESDGHRGLITDISTDGAPMITFNGGQSTVGVKLHELQQRGYVIIPAAESSQSAPAIGDTIYRESDGAQGVIADFTRQGDVFVDFANGGNAVTTMTELLGQGYEVIPAAEVEAGQQHADRVGRDHATMVKVSLPGPVATLLNRRKRKATRRNRARVGGGF